MSAPIQQRSVTGRSKKRALTKKNHHKIRSSNKKLVNKLRKLKRQHRF